MSVWTAIRSIFASTGAPPQDIGLQYNAPYSTNTKAADVSFDSAMQISAVWAAVRLISETISSLPFEIYEKNADGSLTPANNLAVRDLLVDGPNNLQTPVEFWESILLNLVTSGNAYCLKETINGKVISLKPVSSQQMETELLPDGATVIHRYTTGANVRVYGAESVWHIKLFGNSIVGMSPLSYAVPAIAIAQAADDRVNKIYSNGAKPSGVLMIDRVLTDEQRAQVRSNFKNLSNGDDDRLFVLEADMKYQQVSMSPTDIQLLESRRFQIEDIGRFFGVPSVLLNQTVGQSSLGSNVYEIMQAFYKLNLRPYIEKIESSVVRWLIPEGDKAEYIARFDFDALLRADSLSRAQTYREMINSGQLTPNEARREEGREAMEGGDALMVQGAMVPIEKTFQDDPDPEPFGGGRSTPDDDDDGGGGVSEQLQEMQRSLELEIARKSEPQQLNLYPQFNVTVNPGEAPEIKVENLNIKEMPVPIVNNEVKIDMPEGPVPNVQIDVQPPEVVVVDNHPKRAVQSVERDQNGDVGRTIIEYERD